MLRICKYKYSRGGGKYVVKMLGRERCALDDTLLNLLNVLRNTYFRNFNDSFASDYIFREYVS